MCIETYIKYVDKYNVIKNAKSVDESISIFVKSYNIEYITYHMAKNKNKYADSPYVRTTYPDAWVARYLLKNYVEIDPVTKEGFMRQLPFHWSEIALSEDTNTQAFLQDSLSYGIPLNGYSMPVVDKFNRRALISVCSLLPEEGWRQIVRSFRSEWLEIANIIHQHAVAEVYGAQDPMPYLSRREVECLHWAALGKDYLDISLLLHISAHTVRGYLKSARFKLGCANLSSAVSKAIQLNIISPHYA